MKTIRTTNGYEFVVDDKDYPLLSLFKWRGRKTKHGYVGIGATISITPADLLMLGTGNLMTDHKNRNALDWRRANLRKATPAQNRYNAKGHSRSGYKGVSCVAGRYRAVITKEGKRFYLGSFDTAEKAAAIYNVAAKKLFGEFAFLNNEEQLPPPATNTPRLRAAHYTRSQGGQDRPPLGASGYKGVTRNGRQWLAKIRKDYRSYHLGRFETKEEAAQAYNEGALRHYGPSARLNEIKGDT